MRKKRYILHCLCGASTEDIRKNPNAWDRWIIAPKQVCPVCVAHEIAHREAIKTLALQLIGQGVTL